MHWHKIMASIMSGLMFACVSLGCNSSCSSEVSNVSGHDFALMYDQPRSDISHKDYAGVKGGYHYLVVYNSGQKKGIDPRFRGYIRTPVDQLPSSFPDHPQPPMQLGMMGEVEQ